MLSNITVDGRASVQTILLGQPQFRATLANPDLEQLRQRVLASYHLGPLTEAETRAYVEHRLKRVGWVSDPRWDDAAFTYVFRYTDGIPRRINTLCSRVLLYGAIEEAHTITGPMVETTANELSQDLGAGLAAPQPAASAATRCPRRMPISWSGGSRRWSGLGPAGAGVPPSARSARARWLIDEPACPQCPVQCDDGRCRGLFPGAGVCRLLDRAEWDGLAPRVEANVDRILEQFAERRRRTPRSSPSDGSPNATRPWFAGSSPRGMNSPVTATTIPAPMRRTRRHSAPTSAARGGCSRISAALRCMAIVPRHSPSARAINGRSACWRRQATPTAPASIRSAMTFMACPTHRACRSAPTDGALWEIPMTTLRAFGRNWPCSGGGYFRLLPYSVFRHGLTQVNRRSGPASSTSIPGRSIPTSRASRAAAGSRAFATTPIFRAWRRVSIGCWAISPGTGWTACLPMTTP